MATFEQPLNERIRAFSRLEQLNSRIRLHSQASSQYSWNSHVAVLLILDMYELTSRIDLKSEVMKELERQAQVLQQFAGSNQIDSNQLSDILEKQRAYIQQLHEQQGQLTQHIKTSEFLNNVRQRCAASGSACSYDLPIYHHWLNQSHQAIQNDIQQWMQPFETTLNAIDLILCTIRESTGFESLTAEDGFFQQALSSVRAPQLIRVKTTDNTYPEISGSKHRMSIRFFEFASVDARPSQSTGRVNFEMALCTI
ncbi:MAG: cell division protein ZapD [Pseudomonadota bacterium]